MIIFYPFALLYNLITTIRNYAYSIGIFKSYRSPIKTIIVGNLSTGGTGKTPHTSYILQLLSQKSQPTVLSRGYKRTTKGVIIADSNATALQIGDEPMEYKIKHPDINVVVGEKRVDAIKKIEANLKDTNVIILDDAFQHRAIKGHLNILLTTYQKPYFTDFVLPSGSLRENRCGAKRADIIIVTKCPQNLNSATKDAYLHKIQPKNHQKVFFTSYKYCKPVDFFTNKPTEINQKQSLYLITGIANNLDIVTYYKNKFKNVAVIRFKDHKAYDASTIKNIINKIPLNSTIILTRKDAVKWYPHYALLSHYNVIIQDITIEFLENQTLFDSLILKTVNSNEFF